jgi:hypothetical protein
MFMMGSLWFERISSPGRRMLCGSTPLTGRRVQQVRGAVLVDFRQAPRFGSGAQPFHRQSTFDLCRFARVGAAAAGAQKTSQETQVGNPIRLEGRAPGLSPSQERQRDERRRGQVAHWMPCSLGNPTDRSIGCVMTVQRAPGPASSRQILLRRLSREVMGSVAPGNSIRRGLPMRGCQFR